MAAYISRKLLANKGEPDERLVTEDEVATLQSPLVILGDPGLGKTKLTESLENKIGTTRVTGGAFYRNEDPARFAVAHGRPLIIDGLDEITSSSGGSAVDEVLKKLSRIGSPRFILSCRSADWQGSTDRYKIAVDYGAEPKTLHLQPFSYEEARRFLSTFDESIDAETILNELSKRDLEDFYGNPLTLSLLAELARDKQGLPKSRADLFNRACELLLRERNRAHQRSLAAQSSLDALLDSAGAIFAHLLLSASLGIADRHRDDVPEGYISKGDASDLADAPLITAVLKTRLFQSVGENLSIPFHRVIAEYLGARWLSKRMSAGLSERRVLQILTFADGVPTALRGLHAWLAHFNPEVADRCIQIDPYGVLRYGEPDRLPVERAKLLLNSLGSLANEDPYFRSEDWGRRAVGGLARPELKGQIVDLIKHPDRHYQLSTLILQALPGSSLTHEIVPELMLLILDSGAPYVERINAAEALIKGSTKVDWVSTVQALANKAGNGNKRLALEIIARVRGAGFSGDQVADVLLDYQRIFSADGAETGRDGKEENDDDRYVSGTDYMLVKELSPPQCADVLDRIAARIAAMKKPRHWRAGSNLSTTVHRFVVKALEDGSLLSAERLWSWLRFLEGTRGYSSEDRERVRDFLKENPILRREIQKLAFNDSQIDGAPWMAIVHNLPAVSTGLALTVEDTAELLVAVALKETLSNFDIELWASLVRSKQLHDGLGDIQRAIKLGTGRHGGLQRQWEELTAPPKQDWRTEQEGEQARARKNRRRRFGRHRAKLLPVRDRISSGAAIGPLNRMANAYLNRYFDLDHDAAPVDRLREWLGDDLTDAALSGFIATLSRDDLPTAQQIAESHAEGKQRAVEPIMTCGIVEMVLTRRSLSGLSPGIAKAALASWWECPDFNSTHLGDEIGKQLEQAVFSDDEAIEDFLTAVMEPRIRAKHSRVPGLYQLPRDERFKRVAGRLALRWLRAYPDAIPATQWELLETAIQHARSEDVKAVIRERLPELSGMEIETRKVWMSAAFLMDFDATRDSVSDFCDEDRNNLWSLRNLIRPERSEQWKPITIQQHEFVIIKFADRWRPAPHPSTGWGDMNPWDASELIRSCINAIGADHSEESSTILDRLVDDPNVIAYIDQIKHARTQQRRLRRDKEFRVPSFSEAKRTLAGGLPGNIDDLKAMILDRLEVVQDYVRNGDTDSWEQYWNRDKPNHENTCRHRLLDALRPRVSAEISFLPETLMPEANRADIVAIYHADGVPIEIKGQWHSEVWDAANVQLIEKYARDWRAHGRGIYLILWFGNVPRKNLPKHPDGLPRPSSPSQLRRMLTDRLTDAERSRIDVFVFDVSRP